jgi:putative membrane protein
MLPRSERIKKLLLFGRPFTNRDKLILRDHLALERTRLANERTFMAYIRSALYLLIGGLALLQLQEYGDLQWVGITSVSLAAIFSIIGIVRFYQLKKQLASYYDPLEMEAVDDPPAEA